MTRYQQQVLTGAIRTAAENQGIKQAELARVAGTSAGNVSYAMACKSNMSEEKWRLICEHVGVDYDAILAEGVHLDAQDAAPEEVQELPSEAVQVPITPPTEEPVVMEVELVTVPFSPEECRIMADLIEAHLVADIRAKDVGFDWMRKVLGIHEKCKRVDQDG